MDTHWLYDEHSQTGTDFANEETVKHYDLLMQPLRDIPGEIETAAQALGVSGDSTVWEIGCGTGELAIGLARRCRMVWASDVSPGMVAYAGRKAEQRGQPNIALGVGGFLSGFAPDGPVDGFASQLALHHIPDFWKQIALRRVAGFLKPGGRLYLRDVVFPDDIADFDAYFTQAVDAVRRVAGDFMADGTAGHFRKEYSTFQWVMEGMLERAGFRVLHKHYDGFFTSYTCERS